MIFAERRTCKVVLISVRGRGDYSRWVWRAVECRPDQHGYLSEGGVEVLWESEPLYRPNACRGQGPAAKAQATEFAIKRLTEICQPLESDRLPNSVTPEMMTA